MYDSLITNNYSYKEDAKNYKSNSVLNIYVPLIFTSQFEGAKDFFDPQLRSDWQF
jgi:hypothetical protein